MATVRPARAADRARLVTTTVRAFADDPLLRWFYPDDDEYQAEVPVAFGPMFQRLIAYGHCYVTDDSVALAGWVPPVHIEVEIPPAELPPPPQRMERFAAVGAILAEQKPTETHWYLQILATHPDWQRQGLGLEVLNAGIALADRDGLPCYLETQTASNVAYYLRHGFTVRSEWDVPLGGPHMWGMIRPA